MNGIAISNAIIPTTNVIIPTLSTYNIQTKKTGCVFTAHPEGLFTVFQLTNYSVKALAYLLARRLAILSNGYAVLPILPQKIVFGTILKPTANRGRI
jgi:hypothetical protein